MPTPHLSFVGEIMILASKSSLCNQWGFFFTLILADVINKTIYYPALNIPLLYDNKT